MTNHNYSILLDILEPEKTRKIQRKAQGDNSFVATKTRTEVSKLLNTVTKTGSMAAVVIASVILLSLFISF